MSTFIKLLFLSFLFISLSCSKTVEEPLVDAHQIIPLPKSVEVFDGSFTLDEHSGYFTETEFNLASSFLQEYLKQATGIKIKAAVASRAKIKMVKDSLLPSEGYTLKISEKTILINAKDASGAFYAVQSLRQLMPAHLEGRDGQKQNQVVLPLVEISDAPQFPYRGMHLDVGRHFFSKEFIKKYIEYLSMLKMNYFHWHLTEDQGWRIEILQYPNLTSHAAYREETLIGHYNDTPQQFDGKRYGGYYTQEEIKEIVAYASQHNVTIIPEIEMPGHAQAAISAYPALGCTGDPVAVATKWGVFEHIYCPKEETFTFLKNVLSEVMELFPGEYIHIGGDEAPKAKWQNCDHCQKLIATHNLKDEHGLQSYFIKEIESFVNSKGKKIIGWDEILEGGLAPNATVMSWRGTQGAIDAAKQGHDVILTPTSHAYFDYYQADHEDEPLAIGGFLPLQKVFGFNPIPEELSTEEATYVLGAQGNIWTEYMTSSRQVEYMAFPRILAMSEVVWNGAATHMESQYPKFLSRVENFTSRLDYLDVNYANHLYDVSGKVIKQHDRIYYKLTTPLKDQVIHYQLNGEEDMMVYQDPIRLNKNTELVAFVLLADQEYGRKHQQSFKLHKGIPAKVSLNTKPHKAYNAGGIQALTNGVAGSDVRFGDKEWLGFWGEDLQITLEFPTPTQVKKISTRFYDANGQWVYAPKFVIAKIYLEDGRIVHTRVDTQLSDALGSVVFASFRKEKLPTTSKIVIEIPNYGMIPEGLQGEGNKAWTFIDELIIE